MSQVTSLKGFRWASIGELQLAVRRRQFSDKHLSTSIDMCRSRGNQGCAGERGVTTTRVAFSFSSPTFFSTLDSKHQRGSHSLLLMPSLVARHWLLLLMALVSNCRINLAVLITRLQKDPPEVGPKDCWSCWILTSSSCDPDVHVPSTFNLPAHSQLIPGRCLGFRTISLFKSPLPKLNCQERQAIGTGAPCGFIYATADRLSRQIKIFMLVFPCVKAAVASQAARSSRQLMCIVCSSQFHALPIFTDLDLPPQHIREASEWITSRDDLIFLPFNSLSWLSTNSTLGGLLGLVEL